MAKTRRNLRLTPMLDHAPVLQDGTRFMAEKKTRLRENQPFCRLSREDEDLPVFAQYMLSEAKTERRVLKVGADEAGRVVANLKLRIILQRLYQNGEMDFDHWICKCCGYVNPSASRTCRGNLDLPALAVRAGGPTAERRGPTRTDGLD